MVVRLISHFYENWCLVIFKSRLINLDNAATVGQDSIYIGYTCLFVNS